MQFISLNTEDGLNPITASQADFVVDEQDFRGTVRQAMFDSMLEMAAKLPPAVGLKLLAIAFEMSDVPMRGRVRQGARDVTGMADPNARGRSPGAGVTAAGADDGRADSQGPGGARGGNAAPVPQDGGRHYPYRGQGQGGRGAW